MRTVHTVIVGAGPGGLACATRLAEQGQEVLLLERNQQIGPKVCAGGVTWSGLSRHLPPRLIEKKFPAQYIKTNWQSVKISAPHPIIFTVDRTKLGGWMLEKARHAGVHVHTDSPVVQIHRDHVLTKTDKISFQYLVGADGSSSMVRRFLGIPTERLGVGIHCRIKKNLPKMEWHLTSRLFHTGYAWIFPHQETASVGAYVSRRDMAPRTLLRNFHTWLDLQGLSPGPEKPRAALINFDYRGYCFDNFFLVGDAAGLASGLTGEGIFPAIVSGEAVADKILSRTFQDDTFARLIQKHKKHTQLLELAGKSKIGCKLLIEFLVFAIDKGLVPFHALEMGTN